MKKTDDTISFSIPCYPEPLQMTRQVQDIVFDQDKKIRELEKRLARAEEVIDASKDVLQSIDTERQMRDLPPYDLAEKLRDALREYDAQGEKGGRR